MYSGLCAFIIHSDKPHLLKQEYKDKQRDDAEHGGEQNDLSRKLVVTAHAFCHDVARYRGRCAEQNKDRT